MVFILQSYISDTIPISQELESEPRKLRSRFAECSVSCLAVEVEYRNTDWRRFGEVVEKFCGYQSVRQNNRQCRSSIDDV